MYRWRESLEYLLVRALKYHAIFYAHQNAKDTHTSKTQRLKSKAKVSAKRGCAKCKQTPSPHVYSTHVQDCMYSNLEWWSGCIIWDNKYNATIIIQHQPTRHRCKKSRICMRRKWIQPVKRLHRLYHYKVDGLLLRLSSCFCCYVRVLSSLCIIC